MSEMKIIALFLAFSVIFTVFVYTQRTKSRDPIDERKDKLLELRVKALEVQESHLISIIESHNRTIESQTRSLAALGEITSRHTHCIEMLTSMEKAKQ